MDSFVKNTSSKNSEHCFINKSRFHVATTRSKHSLGVIGDFEYFLDGCCSPIQAFDLEESLFSRLIMSEQHKQKPMIDDDDDDEEMVTPYVHVVA
jgi:hypothetical protein